MTWELTVAGAIAVMLGLGHEAVGRKLVLPHVTRGGSGPLPNRARSLMRVTWHIVTIFALATGGLLLDLGFAPRSDVQTALLRWFAVMWVAAALMAFLVARPRLAQIARLPVPLLWVLIAMLLMKASI